MGATRVQSCFFHLDAIPNLHRRKSVSNDQVAALGVDPYRFAEKRTDRDDGIMDSWAVEGATYDSNYSSGCWLGTCYGMKYGLYIYMVGDILGM